MRNVLVTPDTLFRSASSVQNPCSSDVTDGYVFYQSSGGGVPENETPRESVMEGQGRLTFDSQPSLRTTVWSHKGRIAAAIFSAALVMGTVAPRGAEAQTVTILHSFTGPPSDGLFPMAGLIRDSSGNLYGTTQEGGSAGVGGYAGYGTVFKIPAAGGTLTVLHSFGDGTVTNDGQYPLDGLILDGSGNLYGTTHQGGSAGAGTVFKIPAAGGTLTVLHSFGDGTVTNDGVYPFAGLILDGSGNLYGTTYGGGSAGAGTIFKIPAAGGTLTVLHSFSDGTVTNDGEVPLAGLILDGSGNLYGTTQEGGSATLGTVFKIPVAGGTLTLLHSFGDGTVTNDGQYPRAGLILDSSGNLYGTTESGGSAGYGTVFKIPAAGGTLTLLHSFGDGTVTNDGQYPFAGLILDGSGNLYGTTDQGGSEGTVFKIPAAGGTLTVLHSFGTVTDDGAFPGAGLIPDGSGNLYGTTGNGGSAFYGTVFKLSGSGFVPPVHFAGVPGTLNCTSVSVSNLAHTYGGMAAAAKALGFTSVSALQNAISAYCSGN